MKFNIATLLLALIPALVQAAPECAKSGEYGARVYLVKKAGQTLSQYREVEGPPPLPVVDEIERAIFNTDLKSPSSAAALAKSVCEKHFSKK